MYIVTFHSYRGGVGRTTALVNVAVDLALRGRRVLLVDFDLEAPSLPSFALLRPKVGAPPGLVEFIHDYLRSGKAPDIAGYVYAARDDVYPARLIGENKGEILVMPAGRGDDHYWRALHQIDWKELYELQDGFVLFEDMKYQWRQSFKPNYVLIDARAGINDRLAICTRQLPDAVVALHTPDNEEEEESFELTGVRRVLRDVVEESQQSGQQRIDVLAVATQKSYLDTGDQGGICIVDDFDPDFDSDDATIIQFDHAATIPYAPESLLERQVVANLRPRQLLPLAYRQLATALMRSNCGLDREGAQRLLIELQANPDRAVAVPAVDRDAGAIRHWFDDADRLEAVIMNFRQEEDAEILAQAASCLFLAGRYNEALATLDEAIDLEPADNTLLWQRTSGRAGAALVTVALADSILWQRASYRRQLKAPGEVDDLLRLLDTPKSLPSRSFDGLGLKREFEAWTARTDLPDLGSVLHTAIPKDTGYELIHQVSGIDPYVASAFQRLRQLGKVQKALQMPLIQRLSAEARQALLDEVPVKPIAIKQDPVKLIKAKKWRVCIDLLEPLVAQSASESFFDYFFLAMAFWGIGDEARTTELCRSAREGLLKGSTMESILQELDFSSVDQIPALSLVFWKAGDSAAAKRFLDRCDELLTAAPEDLPLFSVWRFCRVESTQFQEDCHSQRQMFHGAVIRPYFLGKALARA